MTSLKEYLIKDDITVTQEVDLDQVNTDVGLNNTHRGTVAGNPHAVQSDEVPLADAPGDFDAVEIEAGFTELGPLNNGSQVDTHDHVKIVEFAQAALAGDSIRISDAGGTAKAFQAYLDQVDGWGSNYKFNVPATPVSYSGAIGFVSYHPPTDKLFIVVMPEQNNGGIGLWCATASVVGDVVTIDPPVQWSTEADGCYYSYKEVNAILYVPNVDRMLLIINHRAPAYDTEAVATSFKITPGNPPTINWGPNVIVGDRHQGFRWGNDLFWDPVHEVVHFYGEDDLIGDQFQLGPTVRTADIDISGINPLDPNGYGIWTQINASTHPTYKRSVQWRSQFASTWIDSANTCIFAVSDVNTEEHELASWHYDGNDIVWESEFEWSTVDVYYLGSLIYDSVIDRVAFFYWDTNFDLQSRVLDFDPTTRVITLSPEKFLTNFPLSYTNPHRAFAPEGRIIMMGDQQIPAEPYMFQINDANDEVDFISKTAAHSFPSQYSVVEVFYHPTEHVFIAWNQNGSTTYREDLNVAVYAHEFQQLYAEEFMGFAQETAAAGESKSVAINGQISRGHTSLEIGSRYYLQADGSIDTIETTTQVGKALTATELIVDIDDNSHPLVENIHYLEEDIILTSDQINNTVEVSIGPTHEGRVPILNNAGQFDSTLVGSSPMSLWNTVAKDAAYTAVAGDEIFADTQTIGAFDVTLPLTPTIGDRVRVSDAIPYFTTNNLTILRNGENIKGITDDLILDINAAMIEFLYVDATYGWSYILYV